MDLIWFTVGDRLEVNRRPGKKMPNSEVHIAYMLIEKYKIPSPYLNLMYAYDFALGWDEETYKVHVKIYTEKEVMTRELPIRVGSKEGLRQVAMNFAKWKQLLLKNSK